MKREIRKECDGFLKYVNESPTPYHSATYLSGMLACAGAIRLGEEDEWEILPDRLYYLVKNGTLLSFFRISSRKKPLEYGFHIAGAHHDAPGFRVKPAVSTVDDGYERLTLEPYGGLIQHVWLDRPLACAGRIYYDNGEKTDSADFNIRKPFAVIPSAAIHLLGSVNEGAKFDLQTELRPFVAQSPSGEPSFLNYAAKAAGIPNRRILSFDIVLYDAAPAGYAGLHDEFLSSPHLDDCEMAYALTAGAVSEDAADHSFVAFVYDHEECGSASDRGAQSGFFEALLERLCGRLGYSREDLFRTMARSVIFSADMAHAAHPSYPQTGDPDTKVRLNRGPVLKLNANQSYATSASGSAYFKKLCTESGIPYQEYVNRSTIRGGRTIGPMLSAKSGMIAVDIGNPLLAMHSAREFGGTEDLYHMRRLFSAFF